jgi:hypothetical protein
MVSITEGFTSLGVWKLNQAIALFHTAQDAMIHDLIFQYKWATLLSEMYNLFPIGSDSSVS